MRPTATLLLLAAALPCADLPVTGVRILPDGGEITLAGSLPAGDEEVRVWVGDEVIEARIDGAPAAWTSPPRHDPPADQEERRTACRQRLEAAQHALAWAEERQDVVLAAIKGMGEPDPGLPPVFSSATRQQAVLDFVRRNAEQVQRERAAAEALRQAAERELEAIEAEAPEPARIRLVGGGGKTVHLRLRRPALAWEPAYRLEAGPEGAVLVRLARLHGAQGLPTAPYELLSRSPVVRGLLPPPAVVELGVGEVLGGFAQPRERILGGFGGGRIEAAAASPGSAAFQRFQADDGGLGAGPGRVHTTALVMLSLLGQGYDHRTPNRHRELVRRGLDFLRRQQPSGLPLADLALSACALGEAHAMTADPELRPEVQVRLDLLRRRIQAGNQEPTPHDLVFTAMAFKSGLAGGLPVEDALPALKGLIGRQGGAADGSDAALARRCSELFLGHPPEEDAVAAAIAAQGAAWLQQGRYDLLWFASLVLFQTGGQVWQDWNATVRDGLTTRKGGDGLWPRGPAGDELVNSAYASLALSVYYRYAPVPAARPAASRAGKRRAGWSGGEAGPPPSDPRQSLLRACQGWPVRWTTPPVTPGAGAEVEVDRIPLPGTVSWQAFPLSDPWAWRRLDAVNPLTQPLPAGPLTVRWAGGAVGQGRLPFTRPWSALALGLGRDERFKVERLVSERSQEGSRRTVRVELRFRLQAPSGAPPVQVVEPMPIPAGSGVVCRIEVPEALEGRALEERGRTDPFWRLPLAQGGEALAAYAVEYPPERRPFLEYQR